MQAKPPTDGDSEPLKDQSHAGTKKVPAGVDGARGADGRQGRVAGGSSLSGYPTLGCRKAGFAEDDDVASLADFTLA
jgi:hypothetical protein